MCLSGLNTKLRTKKKKIMYLTHKIDILSEHAVSLNAVTFFTVEIDC